MDNQDITQFGIHTSSMGAPSPSFSSNSHSSKINFHFETQEENNQKSIQSFKVDLLNPYKFYDVNTLVSSIKGIVTFRQHNLNLFIKPLRFLYNLFLPVSKKPTFLFFLNKTLKYIGIKVTRDNISVPSRSDYNFCFLEAKMLRFSW